MRVFSSIEEAGENLSHPLLTIGNFDSVHLGHQALIRDIQSLKKQIGGEITVLSFDPHPKTVLGHREPPKLINTADEKSELLKERQIEAYIRHPFTREFSSLTPDEFFNTYLLHTLHIQAIIVGHDFKYGKNQKGNFEHLKKRCEEKGIQAKQLQTVEVEWDGKKIPVSSSQIRQSLQEGNIQLANALLGRNFFVRGIVVKGDGRGHQLGIPTANLFLKPRLLPKPGVYATWAWDEKNLKHPSLTNVGFNPTFLEKQELRVESHLLNFKGDLYGKPLKLEFISRLRDEMRFSSTQLLIDQIEQDISQAQELFAAH